MDAGVDAVRSRIVSEFNPGSVTEHFDNSHTSTDLGFLADGAVLLYGYRWNTITIMGRIWLST
jgi:hypothetical protein